MNQKFIDLICKIRKLTAKDSNDYEKELDSLLRQEILNLRKVSPYQPFLELTQIENDSLFTECMGTLTATMHQYKIPFGGITEAQLIPCSKKEESYMELCRYYFVFRSKFRYPFEKWSHLVAPLRDFTKAYFEGSFEKVEDVPNYKEFWDSYWATRDELFLVGTKK